MGLLGTSGGGLGTILSLSSTLTDYLHPPPLNKKGSISSRLWIFLILDKVLIRFYLLLLVFTRFL